MTKLEKTFLFILVTVAAAGTITLAYGAYQYTGNRTVHEECEIFE